MLAASLCNVGLNIFPTAVAGSARKTLTRLGARVIEHAPAFAFTSRRARSAGTRHLMGFSPVQLRDRRVELSFPRPIRPKVPARSLLSMTGPAGGADAPSLTFAARAGALVERPGRGNALRGGPNQRMWASAVGWRLRTREFPLPLPRRCSACGKRKPEVDGARWVIVSGAGDHPTKR